MSALGGAERTCPASGDTSGLDPKRTYVHGDPVEDGLVTSFNRPGGNATGIRLFNADIVAKRLQLLHDLVPAASSVGFLVKSSNPTSSLQKKSIQSAAATIGLRVVVLEADEE
jgi:putative tryptophan/tyrosine transport system substrate-binding protein